MSPSLAIKISKGRNKKSEDDTKKVNYILECPTQGNERDLQKKLAMSKIVTRAESGVSDWAIIDFRMMFLCRKLASGFDF